LSSDFFKTLLSENQRDTVQIIIPDIDPEILKKLVEYIYIGYVSLDSKYMAGMILNINLFIIYLLNRFLIYTSDFIEACNLVHLKATISCERKLIFNKQKTSTFTAKATSTPIAPSTATRQANLNSLIEDLEQEEVEAENENVEYHLKHEESGGEQILEVYEISNLEDAEITYETTEDNEDMSEEQYELLNVVGDNKPETIVIQQVKKKEKSKAVIQYSDMKPRTPTKPGKIHL
jgi:hypothetical protein